MPTLQDINDEVPAQAPELGVLRHNAEWADTFGTNSDPRAPVNLATRARYKQDRVAYATARVDEHERQTRQAIQTDKTRQALFFKTQRLTAQQDAAQFKMGLSQQKHDAEMSLVPLKKDALTAQTRSAVALEASRTATAAHKAELEKHVLALESDSGVFRPSGFGFTGSDPARKSLSEIASLLKPLGADTIGPQGGGADIGPAVAAAKIPAVSLDVDGSRYFLLHHTAADTVDKLDPKDLADNAAAIAFLSYVVADLPAPLPRP